MATVTGVLMLLGACSEKSTDEQLKEARASLAAKQVATAIVQLKVTLKQHPDLAEARFLFGEALLDGGDPAPAAVELRKALDLGYPRNQSLPLLARSLLTSQQHKKLINEFSTTDLDDPKAVADLKTSLAAAYAINGDRGKAQEAIAMAERAVPDFPATLMLKARFAAEQHNYDLTLALLDKALAIDPSSPEGWVQKGESLLVARQDAAGAADAFRRALSLRPNHLGAQSGLVSLAISQKNWKEAAERLEELRSNYPEHPQTALFDAQLVLVDKKPAQAKQKIELALKAMPDNVQALQLAGAIHLANGSLVEAERSLNKALSLQPDLPFARRELARTQLRLGEPTKVLSTLQPLTSKNDRTASTYALAGEAYMQLGKLDQGIASYSEAAQLEPANSAYRTQLALAKHRKAGAASIDALASELTQIAASDSGTSADLALFTALMKSNQPDRALKAADAIERKQPDSPVASNLRGRAYLQKNDIASARTSFEKALVKDPAYVPAALSLATLDVQSKKPADAKKRFDTILARNPNDAEALLALAKIRMSEKAPSDEIARLLGNAAKLNPTEAEPRLLLVELYLARHQDKLALDVAQEAVTALPGNPDVLDALGRAQLASGDAQQALMSFKKLSGMEPRSTRSYVRIAGAHLTTNNVKAAESSLQQALRLYPAYLPIQEQLYKIALTDNRPRDAAQIAQTIQAQRPGEMVGYGLEATAEVARKNPDGAVAAYRKGFKKNPRTDFAINLHSTLLSARQIAEADQMAAAWLSDYPKDIGFLAYVGNLAMVRGNYEKAEQYFRSVLKLQPDNAAALNNIAWVMSRLKKPGAVEYAERALKLEPDTPGLMDTLALALAAEGQPDKALEIQKKAIALAPQDQMLHLNLAKILLQTGDKQNAAAELKALEKLGDKFAAQPEVARMLKAM
jgi:putative PEP-CTERM system TPR-repeat lipoprotein